MITTLPSQKGIVYNDEYRAQYRKAFQPVNGGRERKQSAAARRLASGLSTRGAIGSKQAGRPFVSRAAKARQELGKGNEAKSRGALNESKKAQGADIASAGGARTTALKDNMSVGHENLMI